MMSLRQMMSQLMRLFFTSVFLLLFVGGQDSRPSNFRSKFRFMNSKDAADFRFQFCGMVP